MTVLVLDCQADSVVPPVAALWLSGNAAIVLTLSEKELQAQ